MAVGPSSGLIIRFRRCSAPVAGALLVCGCFHYVPASYPPPPRPNSEVRIELATPRDIPMGEFTLNEVTVIEGVVAEGTSDTLALWARWIRPRVGRKYDAAGATFYLPRREIARVDGWQLAPKLTAAVVGIAVASATLIVRWAWRSRDSGRPPVTPPDVTSIVAPR